MSRLEHVVWHLCGIRTLFYFNSLAFIACYHSFLPHLTDARAALQAEEKRSVSQDLEVWMSTTEVEGGFALIARAGRLLQEIRVTTKLTKDELRGITQKVLKQLSSR